MDDLSMQPIGDQLTQRELEILRLVANGLTNQEIAGRLFITLSTVKWYLKQVFSKLHVGSRTQAIALARTSGLLGATTDESAPTVPHRSLPAQSTPFIGREIELAEITRLLRDAEVRLVTILGPGGIGKTRLTLEAAAAQINDFRDGVFFVALAALSDPNLMVTAIAEAVGLSFAPGQPPKNQLLKNLRDRRMLLVLDNMEHLLAGVGLLPELQQTAPEIKILVTSRERLQLQSEVVFRLEGLASADWPTPEAAAESSAARLFLQSARRVKPSFELTRDTLAALSSICRLVRGMPLGILLAASWIDTLTIAEIAQEIERSFEFLEGDWRDLPARQRSLRAVFEHSWNLLTEVERSAMRCFSVFRSGFTREAAQQVAGASLKTLISLVNKSLLSRDPSGRFDVHELLRQYSEKELDQRPQEHEQVQVRHAAYYAAFMDKQWIPLRSAKANEATDEIETEFNNVRAAWKAMVEQEQFPLIIMTARSLWMFLNRRAQFDEGIELFGRATEKLRNGHHDPLRDRAICELLVGLSNCYEFNGLLNKAKMLAEESLAVLQGYNVPELAVLAYIPLCLAEANLEQQQDMQKHAQLAIAAAQGIADPWYRATGLFLWGWARLGMGEYEDAYRAGEEALSYFQDVGDPYFQGLCLTIVLGPTAFAMEQYDEAERYYRKGIAFLESTRNSFEASLAGNSLFYVYAQTREYEAANRVLQRGLRYFWETGPVPWLLDSLLTGSKLFEIHGKYAWSLMTLSLVENHPEAFQGVVRLAQAEMEHLRRYFSSEDFSSAYERGKALDLRAVVAELLVVDEPDMKDG
jgi:predicted ATPase/DNA-binding CsgD family transcriptional regulator